MRLTQHENLYLYSMGKRLRVTAIFTNAKAANAYMERDANAACIAAFGGPDDPRGEFIFLADKNDGGLKI